MYAVIALWFAMTTRNVKRISELSPEAVKFLNDHPHLESVSYRVEFEGSRMTALLSLKDYHGSKKVWAGLMYRSDLA